MMSPDDPSQLDCTSFVVFRNTKNIPAGMQLAHVTDNPERLRLCRQGAKCLGWRNGRCSFTHIRYGQSNSEEYISNLSDQIKHDRPGLACLSSSLTVIYEEDNLLSEEDLLEISSDSSYSPASSQDSLSPISNNSANSSFLVLPPVLPPPSIRSKPSSPNKWIPSKSAIGQTGKPTKAYNLSSRATPFHTLGVAGHTKPPASQLGQNNSPSSSSIHQPYGKHFPPPRAHPQPPADRTRRDQAYILPAPSTNSQCRMYTPHVPPRAQQRQLASAKPVQSLDSQLAILPCHTSYNNPSCPASSHMTRQATPSEHTSWSSQHSRADGHSQHDVHAALPVAGPPPGFTRLPVNTPSNYHSSKIIV
eukprot:g39680.t1